MRTPLSDCLSTIAPVPPAAADAYLAGGPALIAAVNRALEMDPRRADLLGPGALAVAFDNHANHWRFMVAS